MYFEGVNTFNLNENISNLDCLYSHTKEEGDKEKLEDHMDLTYKYFLKVIRHKNLDLIFANMEKTFFAIGSTESINIWKELIINAIYLHDIGKINVNFQSKVMDNEKYKGEKYVSSKHSMLSACIYFDYYFNKLIVSGLEEEDLLLLLVFLIFNTYIISKHHGSLSVFEDFKDTFRLGYKTYYREKHIYKEYNKGLVIGPEEIDNIFILANKKIRQLEESKIWNCIDIYIYTKLIFSLLVTSDFYATSHYKTNKEIDSFGTINDYEYFFDIYKSGKIHKNIDKYKKYLQNKEENPFAKNDINLLRTQIFLEAEECLNKSKQQNIFYLEAPTGSGKTNTSINLAFNLIKTNPNLNKIFYVFPFNTLVEQTKESLDDVFEHHDDIKRRIAVINSLTPIKTEDIEETNEHILIDDYAKKIDYEKSLLNRQFLHYPIVLTTHVNFFNYLFGNSKDSVFPLSHIANSVIVLDEIQSYKNYIWKEIILFLKKYSEILNLKIIIMSATLPRLNELIGDDKGFVNLIKDRDIYYNNPLFKNRVKVDYSLLNEEPENMKQKVVNKIIDVSRDSNANILVGLIKKATVLDMFKTIKESYEKHNIKRQVLLMTGDDNKIERKRIIDKVKKETNITLVATQVVEAGIDIDMDIGFKDMSILDSEEQFLGRINRSCLKDGSIVYFFNLDEPSTIYKGDYRKNNSVTLQQEEVRDILKNKNFALYYKMVMEMINEDLYRYDDRNIDKFRLSIVSKLNYTDITERMKLIADDRKEYQVFLSRVIEDENEKLISGEDVWNDYIDILRDNKIGYAQKKVALSYIIERMNYFVYKVDKVNVSYQDVAGDIFYISDGQKYFTDNKFDRELFNKASVTNVES